MRFTSLILLSILLFHASGALGDSEENFDVQDRSRVLARGGSISVQVLPPRLVLGRSREARIEVTLPSYVEKVTIFPCRGRVLDLTVDSAGTATARYEPPSELFPQIDVIAALVNAAGENHWGFTTVLLVGRGHAEIQTRGNTDTVIHIGKRMFGPVRSDGGGRATIQIEVPPGVHCGYDGDGKKVDLLLPRIVRAAVFAETREIFMDSPSPVEIFGIVVAEDGSRDDMSSLDLVADRGRVGEIEALGKGAYRAKYFPPAKGQGVIQIQARLEDDGNVYGTTEIVLVPVSRKDEKGELPAGIDVVSFPVEPGIDLSVGRRETGPHRLYSTPKLGFAWNMEGLRAFYAAVDLGIAFSLSGGRFSGGAEIGLSLARDEKTMEDLGEGVRAKTTMWIVPMVGVFAWRWPFAPSWTLALAMEMGDALVSTRLDTFSEPDGTEQLERTHCFAAGGRVAVERALGIGSILAETRYLGIGGERRTISGKLSALYFNIGYRFGFL